MITYWQQVAGQLVERTESEIDSNQNLWVDARSVTKSDIEILQSRYGVQTDDIVDILDRDELSRVERDEAYTLIVIRTPVSASDDASAFFTAPLGIIFYGKIMITICWTDCEVLKGMAGRRAKNLDLRDFPAFAVQVMSRADLIFLRCLKEINRRSNMIQSRLEVSITNDTLIELQNLEKSLVVFTTSLANNQLLLEKLMKSPIIKFDEADRDLLADVELDNRQAIEMAKTYSEILAGMMDSFASVISNNLNIIMKKLTVISLILMIPTLITSFFGMNMPLPLRDYGWRGTIVISVLCIISSFLVAFFLSDKPFFKRQKEKSGQ